MYYFETATVTQHKPTVWSLTTEGSELVYQLMFRLVRCAGWIGRTNPTVCSTRSLFNSKDSLIEFMDKHKEFMAEYHGLAFAFYDSQKTRLTNPLSVRVGYLDGNEQKVITIADPGNPESYSKDKFQ